MDKEWQITQDKFLNKTELAAVLRRMDEIKTIGEAKKRPQLIRDWMLINTFLFTGLRRFEVCELHCSDFKIFGGNSYLIVRRGKGGKSRQVHLPPMFKKNVAWYLRYKAERGEIESPETFFLRTERSEQYSPSGIYKRWKKYVPAHRLHDARHTCATALYEATLSLRLVQKTLGHASISSTQIYADVPPDQMISGMTAMEKLVQSTKKPSRAINGIASLITPPESTSQAM